MKKILIILALVTGLAACHNEDWEFEDFDYTTGYFPYQFPIRTLVLGDYIFDNTNDNNHMFRISAAIGGIYENERNRVFTIQYAPELCTNILMKTTLATDTVRLMPPSYYTLSSPTLLVVPAGEVNGGIDVQLTDAFFNDPLSYKYAYVIPLKLTGSEDVDTILSGKTYLTTPPDVRSISASDWVVLPKNFTMFAVKFVNEYHGAYLHRGINFISSGGVNIATNRYHAQDVEKDEVWRLTTAGRNKVTVTGSTHAVAPLAGTVKMDLTFDASGNCTITKAATAAPADYDVTGTGKFVSDVDSWGGKTRDAIHMNYTFTAGGNTLTATDTLVIRDRAVTMEVFQPVIYVP